MESHLSLISQSALFRGIQLDQVEALLRCLDARQRTFPKGEIIFRAGTSTTTMGLVLQGSVRVDQEDYWGNRSILSVLGPGQTFGEVYACEAAMALDVNVTAANEVCVLFLDVGKIATTCSTACVFHAQLIRNLLGIVARRARMLARKIEHTAKRTTRAKLLSYLSDQAKEADSSVFLIPFNRQELADYLGVERSAMCAEMSRMRKDGIIGYQRNRFELSQVDLLVG